MEFRHPKYYKELERIRKEFEDEQKQKASSHKRQATCQPEPDITEDS
jgi:hypothetical protein